MILKKYNSQLPPAILKYLKSQKDVGKNVWFLIYEALIEKYPFLKKDCK